MSASEMPTDCDLHLFPVRRPPVLRLVPVRRRC